jgi:MFS family permease
LDAVLAGVTSVFAGIYAGRFGITRLGALGFVLLAASSVLTIAANDIPLMLVSMGLFGAGIGIVMQMQNLIWPEFFGRTHIGAIRGYVMPITLAFSAIGAPFAGHIYDSVGSYNPVWWGAVGLMCIGGVMAAMIKRPTATK